MNDPNAIEGTEPHPTMLGAGRFRWRISAVVAGSLGVGAITVGAWWLASRVNFVVPSPFLTVPLVVENLTDSDYLLHARATLLNSVGAWVSGALVGTIGGVVLGLSPRTRIIFLPTVLGLYAVPKIVLYPLLIPLLGIDALSKIVMGAIMSAFPIMIIVAGAVAGLRPIYRSLARSLNASKVQTLRKIVLPAILRALVAGLRVGASLAILGVILSEFFVSRRGLGELISVSYNTGRYEDMFATMTLLFALTFVVSLSLWRLEKRLGRFS